MIARNGKSSFAHLLLPIWGGITLLHRVDYRGYYRNFYADAELQLILARQWWRGAGWVLPGDSSGLDAGAIPRGLSMLAAWIYSLSGDWLKSLFWIDILGLCLLWVATAFFYGLFRKHLTPAFLWILWAVLGCSSGPLHPLPTQDLMAISAYLLGLVLLLWGQERGFSWQQQLGAGVCLLVAVWVRWAYLPLVALLPVYFLWENRQGGRSWFFLGHAWMILPMGFIAWTVALRTLTGLPYVATDESALFVSHIALIDPFIWKTLVYFGPQHLEGLLDRFPVLPSWLPAGLQYSSLMMALALLGIWYRVWRMADAGWRLAAGLAGFVAAINLILLLYLSLIHPPERDWTAYWTFVMETRYFVPFQMGALLTLTTVCAVPDLRLGLGRKYLGWGLLFAALGFGLWNLVARHGADPPGHTYPEMGWARMLATADSLMAGEEGNWYYYSDFTRMPALAGALPMEPEAPVPAGSSMLLVWAGEEEPDRVLHRIRQKGEVRLILRHPAWRMYVVVEEGGLP